VYEIICLRILRASVCRYLLACWPSSLLLRWQSSASASRHLPTLWLSPPLIRYTEIQRNLASKLVSDNVQKLPACWLSPFGLLHIATSRLFHVTRSAYHPDQFLILDRHVCPVVILTRTPRSVNSTGSQAAPFCTVRLRDSDSWPPASTWLPHHHVY
jgi:hypothetical protein